MNRKILYLLLFALNAFCLTLNEAISLGLENNKGLISLKKGVNQAQIRLKIAQAIAYPTLNLQKNLQWLNEEENPYSNSVSLSLSQYIFKKGIFDEIRQIKYELEEIEVSYNASEIEVIREIASKYIELLELIEKERVAKARIDYLETLFLMTEQRFNEGLVLKVDVKEAFLVLKEARTKHQILKDSIEIAKDGLGLLIGIPSPSIIISCSLVFKPMNIEEDEKIALKNRVEIKKNLASLNKNKLSPSIIKAKLFPTILLKGDYGLSAKKKSFSEAMKMKEDDNNWSLSLLCTIPLFDGGRLKGEIKSAKLSIEQDEIMLEKTRDELVFEVKSARSFLNNALKTLELKKEYLSLQEERLWIMREMFNEGKQSLKELLDEEQKRNNANFNYLSSIADYEKKKLDYYKALGILGEQFK